MEEGPTGVKSGDPGDFSVQVEADISGHVGTKTGSDDLDLHERPQRSVSRLVKVTHRDFMITKISKIESKKHV